MNVLSRLKQVATISTVAVCISVATISQATAADRYIVSGVESWDTLNIRSQPSAKSAIIGVLIQASKRVEDDQAGIVITTTRIGDLDFARHH